MQWPNTVTNNTIGFYISYNAHDTGIYGCDTTAIVIGDMEKFYILNGNHFEALKDRSLEYCLEYFELNVTQANKRSEHDINVSELIKKK